MTVDNLPALQSSSLPDKIAYARELAHANMLPTQYRKQPANLLYAIEYAEMLGLSPMAAVTGIHVIEGKPSASAGLISGLVRRAGHRLRVWVERDERGAVVAAVATIIRSDDPDFEFRARWTMDRARAAGLAGKAVWRSYPEAMLKARAITEVAREACEEALLGVAYTPEELGAEVNPDGSVVVTDAAPRVAQAGQTIRDAVTEGEVEPPRDVVRMISVDQQKKMGALMREAGITDRDAALAYVADVINRQVTSRNELTMAEAGRVIDELEKPTGPDTPAEEEPVEAEIVEPDEVAGLEVAEQEEYGEGEAR